MRILFDEALPIELRDEPCFTAAVARGWVRTFGRPFRA